jgi:hypothetical protein
VNSWAYDDDSTTGALGTPTGTGRRDARLSQVADRVGKTIWAEVKCVVVGEPYGVDADRFERGDRRLRRPEEEALTSNELGRPPPTRDAALEVAYQQVEGGGDLDQLRAQSSSGGTEASRSATSRPSITSPSKPILHATGATSRRNGHA